MTEAKVPERTKPVALVRALTTRDGLMIVIGSVIGSGIFLVPGVIAEQLGSLRAVLAVWLCGAVLSICGALSLAEMGAMFPGAGGLYIYLRRAYGKGVAFLYGWGLLTMIQTGTIATLGAGFGLYLSRIIYLSSGEQKAAADGADRSQSVRLARGQTLPECKHGSQDCGFDPVWRLAVLAWSRRYAGDELECSGELDKPAAFRRRPDRGAVVL